MQSSSGDSGNGSVDRPIVPRKEDTAAPDLLLRRLLLVDDEPDGAECAAILLRSKGLVVTVVHSAAKALEALQYDKEIEAVLCDVMMPGMNGLQLAEVVRENYPTVKIILMSGYVSPKLLDDRDRPYLFAQKPYRIDAILKLIQS